MLHHQESPKTFYLEQHAQAIVDPTWDDDAEDMRDVRYTFDLKADPAEY